MSLPIVLMPPEERVEFELRYSDRFTLRLHRPDAEYFRTLDTERSEGRIVVENVFVTRRGLVVALPAPAGMMHLTFTGWDEVLGNYPDDWEVSEQEAIRIAMGFQIFMARLAADEALKHLDRKEVTIEQLLKASPKLFEEHAGLHKALAKATLDGTLKKKGPGRPRGAANPRQFELLLIFEHERRRLGSAQKAYEALLARKDIASLLPKSAPENAITTLKGRIEDLRKEYGEVFGYHDPDK